MLSDASSISIACYTVRDALGFTGTTYYSINSAVVTANRNSTTTTPLAMAIVGHINEQVTIHQTIGTRIIGAQLQNKS